MKKQDTIKIGIAVACLLLAGVIFFLLNAGSPGSAGGSQSLGTSADAGNQAGQVTEEQIQELAEGEEGITYGGTGPSPKPVPRRR